VKPEQAAQFADWRLGLLITTGPDREALFDEVLVHLAPHVESMVLLGERAWPALDPRCFLWRTGKVESTAQAIRAGLRQDPHVIAIATDDALTSLELITSAVFTGHYVVLRAETVPAGLPEGLQLAVLD